jgi:hypothetical protein
MRLSPKFYTNIVKASFLSSTGSISVFITPKKNVSSNDYLLLRIHLIGLMLTVLNAIGIITILTSDCLGGVVGIALVSYYQNEI